VIRFVISSVTSILKTIVYGIIGALIIFISIAVMHLDSRPDLKVWHEAKLDEEFKAYSKVNSLEDYLELEDRLFAQLKELVIDKVQPEDRGLINRFQRGRMSDPDRWSRNWNRTFEFPADAPKAGVLLLHGMSDSPYSLRSIGQRLHASGAWVVGLRVPGHGTAPSGLVHMRWKDAAAAVNLAVRHLREKVGDRPLYLVGYSNGGALSVHYVISTLEDKELPPVNGLVLISPAIGVSEIAALAVWQARLGDFLGLDKLAWVDILPEYDPFKYQSFAVNAGDQVYRLTKEIQARFKALGPTGKLKQFPSVLAFQSVVDSTVSTDAVVLNLFNQLPGGGHELVVFDINRHTEVERILTTDPKADLDSMFSDPGLRFTFSLVTNARGDKPDIVLRQKRPDNSEIAEIPLGMKWPLGIYSLSHVALPFPIDDELYGNVDQKDSPRITLGKLDLRGEKGALRISPSDMLRLRWNPFHPYIEQRILEFLQLGE
jgi:pimeloyl-ACP methyl ester carboxylesterase